MGDMMAGVLSDGMSNCRRNFSVWCFLYFSKLLLAALFAIPLFIIVNANVEISRFATTLITSWSLDVISELAMTRENVFTSFLLLLMFYAVVVFLFRQFVNGGIYHSLLARHKVSTRDFFGEAAVLFTGHLKVSALMCLIYIPLVILVIASQIVASLLPDSLFMNFGAIPLCRILARIALVYPFLILGVILSDLLRFRLTTHPSERLPAGLKAAMDIYRTNFVQLNGIYYLYLLPFVAIWIVIEWLAMQLTGGLANTFGVLLELLLFQLCSFLRTGQSLLYMATVGALLKREQPDWHQAPITGACG